MYYLTKSCCKTTIETTDKMIWRTSSIESVTLVSTVLLYFANAICAQQLTNSTHVKYREVTLKNSVQQNSVKGIRLETCSLDPLTGFYRDGYCRTDDKDHGSHTVCARATKDFLDFTKSRGNDLSTPNGRSFPGLKPGDYWCLCAVRWLEAFKMGKVTPVKLKATNEKSLNIIPMNILENVDDNISLDAHDEL